MNTFQSCLIVFNAGAQAPGMDFSKFPGFMGLFRPSKTFAYTSDASLTGVASGILSHPQTTLEGGGSRPFALGLSTIPAGGGAAGFPLHRRFIARAAVGLPVGLGREAP